MRSLAQRSWVRTALVALLACSAASAFAQPAEPVFSSAKKERAALLETLKTLVSIETGSRNTEGLGQLAALIAGKLKELGGQVELVEPGNVYKMEDTPEKIGRMVRATFAGWNHEDSVDRAYGYGLSARHAR